MLTADAGLAQDTRAALAGLARAIESLRPLAEAGQRLWLLPDRPGATSAGFHSPAEIVEIVAARLALPLAATAPPADWIGDIVAAVIAAPLAEPALARIPATHRDLIGPVVDQAAALSVPAMRAATDVRTGDGALLRSYSAGEPGRPAIVLASACGMPAQLTERWMRFLAEDHHVITWETRGLFGEQGDAADFDRLDYSLAAQANDLLDVIDHHDLGSAHVMGLCGGAVIALRAAATRSDRVAALSLWHGDYSGSFGPTTGHQENLKALMSLAVRSRNDAAAINTALSQAAMAVAPPDVAHLVVYPYVTAELFYRYCVLTSATMTTDIGRLLAGIPHRTLVVTSTDDNTAHPAGSHRVAGLLPGATLRVEPHGDHISVFGAGARLRLLLAEILAGSGGGQEDRTHA